ncbi:hypothetical protein [Streptomyces geranii]|uniref:hypothetical protein n=1 Tax=Streptomyces geranii TaxID=2058923 RepID=UPI0013009313|nr:hypothetical protein [Streptomyces geranii]
MTLRAVGEVQLGPELHVDLVPGEGDRVDGQRTQCLAAAVLLLVEESGLVVQEAAEPLLAGLPASPR